MSPAEILAALQLTFRLYLLPHFLPFEIEYAGNDNEEPEPEKRTR